MKLNFKSFMNSIKLTVLKTIRSITGKKKQAPTGKARLRIAKSIDASGNQIDHNDIIIAKSALYGVNKDNKDRKLCHYDFIKHTCRCGITITDLKEGKGCPIKE